VVALCNVVCSVSAFVSLLLQKCVSVANYLCQGEYVIVIVCLSLSNFVQNGPVNK